MKIKSKEIKEKNLAEIIVEIDAEKMENAKADAYKKNRSSISVPGFRRGKAPRKIIERMFGASIFFSDAIEALMPEVLEFVDGESELETVGKPKVSDIDFKEDEPDIGVEVTLELALYPEVELGEYKGLSAHRPEVSVSDDEINEQIEGLRLRNSRIENVDRAAKNGDLINLNFEGFVDNKPFEGGKAENYELELGSNSFIPGFEEKMIGMNVGEERELDLTFPKEYQENLAGKPVLFKVKVNEIKEKILPELDDEFAKDVSEFDTLKEYKANLKKMRQEEKQRESDSLFENALLTQIVESMTVDVPEVMIEELHEVLIDRYIKQMSSYGIDPDNYLRMTGQTVEEFSAGIMAQAEVQVKTNLALEKIAELENIEISAEDIEKEYEEAAENMKIEAAELKKNIKEDALIKDLKMRRAVAIVTENAVATAEEEKPKTSRVKETTEKTEEKAEKATAKKSAAKEPTERSEEKATEKKTASKKTAEKSEEKATEKKPTAKKITEKSEEKVTAKKPAARATTKKADANVEIKSEPSEEKPKKAPAKTAKKTTAEKAEE